MSYTNFNYLIYYLSIYFVLLEIIIFTIDYFRENNYSLSLKSIVSICQVVYNVLYLERKYKYDVNTFLFKIKKYSSFRLVNKSLTFISFFTFTA